MSNKDTKDLLFESLASEESDTLFYTFRKATFKNWCFDKKNSPCSSNALSRAGFFFSGSRSEPAAATCAYCLKEMIFEENDDPWEEHKSHAKMCSFVELGKLDEKEWTVRDFIYLLSGRIAAEQRQNVIQEIKDFEAASTEIETMAMKALNSLKYLLPAPSAITEEYSQVRRDPWFRGREDVLPSTAVVVKEPPPYGKRQGFKPRTPEDYGDGGAFPEIHFAQFPLGMGMGERKGKSEGQIALQYDADGKLRHDAIARIGHDKNKVVYTKLADMRAKVWDEEDEDIQRPDEETIAEQTEKTRLALEKITESKVASALPVRHAEKQAPAQYIRINQKIPRAPPSPPAPVMHSPPRKVTTKDQNDWKIPPCISNWKNPKGFTVSLDKRLAADGRGLQQTHINEGFAKLSEALYIADRKARESVEARAQLEKRVAQHKKLEQEARMREMAAKARQERAGIRKRDEDEDEAVKAREEIRFVFLWNCYCTVVIIIQLSSGDPTFRRDRLDDIRKERNIARNRPDKVDKLMRDRDRDISEKIVLGLPDAKVRSTETQFDQRLFDQNKGLDSGAMDDETYNPYDKAWRGTDSVQQHIYRPSKNIDKDVYGDDLDKIINTQRFVPDKGFSGAEGSSRGAGPVQFEREQDVFGLGDLFQQVKNKRGGERDADREDSKRARH
ncbi:inhibitor of Apoptosis domain protein [Necator americanus]|uniref:Inhibitor of Apoptosis domain protein n=1 Tax=Necator americanus TaxID=51031 RepID=W2TI68_NECAM|nr:inhibitor of Apoptosis domain protein [Necator americanus]ETN80861.1 inhibitor of Apoptosis domain protein [Necator americanus]